MREYNKGQKIQDLHMFSRIFLTNIFNIIFFVVS